MGPPQVLPADQDVIVPHPVIISARNGEDSNADAPDDDEHQVQQLRQSQVLAASGFQNQQ